MRIFYLTLLIAWGIISLSSCFEEDDIVAVHIPGDVETRVIEMGEKYSTQFYYDLNIQDYVSSNLNETWDLAFECSDTAWHVILNSAKMMHAGNAGAVEWESITNDPGVEMIFDNSGGYLDSTAIGDWYAVDESGTITSNNEIFIIDRGTDDNFESYGMKKISMDVVEGEYELMYSELDGSDEKTIRITKDPKYNFRYFSFDDGLVDIAPEKDKWSLKFSRYSTILFTNDGFPYPYSVTGVLLNPNGVRVATDTTDFTSISLSDTAYYEFTDRLDYIGYDWKVYDLDEDKYVIRGDLNYIIRDHDGLYYKFRFIDFYNDQGVRGSVKFEVAKL